MSLKIFKEDNKYHLYGNLTDATSENAFLYLNEKLKNKNKLAINLDYVSKIDVQGMSTLNDLFELAIKENKSFSVSGWGCDDVIDFFFLTDVA